MNTYAATLGAITLMAAGCAGPVDTGDEAEVETTLTEAEFRAALPTVDQLAIDLPGEATSTARAAADIIDQPSQFRAMAYHLAQGTNQTVFNVLQMVDNITDYPSTAVDENTRRWGPFTPDGSPVTQVFFMRLQDDGDLGYSLQWRPADDAEAEFTPIIEGLINGGYNVYKNVGAFNIDYDAAASLNDDIGAQGFAHFEYNTASADRKIHSALQGVLQSQGQPIDAQVDFAETGDEGGVLRHIFRSDLAGEGGELGGSDGLLELAVLVTHYRNDGSGRTDGDISKGSLGAEDSLQVTECWGDDGLVDYRSYAMNDAPIGSVGDRGLCIGFTSETTTD